MIFAYDKSYKGKLQNTEHARTVANAGIESEYQNKLESHKKEVRNPVVEAQKQNVLARNSWRVFRGSIIRSKFFLAAIFILLCKKADRLYCRRSASPNEKTLWNRLSFF